MSFFAGEYDAVVVGAGHAGAEAGLALARLGFETLLLTINLDGIALMACNPAIGGTSKGHLVREIDALGGQMGLNADATMIQMRMLNTAKGPAVHSLRAQQDKKSYQQHMTQTLENTLHVAEGEVKEILLDSNHHVRGVVTTSGREYRCRVAILACGVYLESSTIIGEYRAPSGPCGLQRSSGLSENLAKLGFALRRFKTGTPPRINRRSIDYSQFEEQKGDQPMVPFSFMTKQLQIEQVSCFLGYTNETTHEILRANLHRSPMYSGQIKGTGARYCPSVEDKVVRFPDKKRHQLFLEPEGRHTNEIYVQGMSTSLPEDVQADFIHSIAGLQEAQIMRSAYAIEYDCIDPTQLRASLESKHIPGLFFAGQINGSSGYEEAAAQGLMAGINGALALRKKEPLVLDRSQGYIGVLIDDLVTKGTGEPYRMMTSRAEYRLSLRQDNADLRLTELGFRVGLAGEERYEQMLHKKQELEKDLKRLKKTHVSSDAYLEQLLSQGGAPAFASSNLYDLLKRNEIDYAHISRYDPQPQSDPAVIVQLEIDAKYQGYIKKQQKQIDEFHRLEHMIIPEGLDYDAIGSLRIEARQKLSALRPGSVGQAGRISGVSPADVSILMIYLHKQKGTAL